MVVDIEFRVCDEQGNPDWDAPSWAVRDYVLGWLFCPHLYDPSYRHDPWNGAIEKVLGYRPCFGFVEKADKALPHNPAEIIAAVEKLTYPGLKAGGS